MDLFQYEFIRFTWWDLVDVLVMTVVIYEIRNILRRNLSGSLVFAAIVLIVLWKVVDVLGLKVLKTFLDGIVGLGSLAVVVIFAPEIRKILMNLVTNSWFYGIFKIKKQESKLDYLAVTEAVYQLASTKTGATIVIRGNHDLYDVLQTGEQLNAHLTARMLIAIFQKTSPLHDGAVIIEDNTLKAARCILPVSENPLLPPQLGLRHRSAIGISEVTDAFVIVVSEERSTVSIAYKTHFFEDLIEEELLEHLIEFVKGQIVTHRSSHKNSLLKSFKRDPRRPLEGLS